MHALDFFSLTFQRARTWVTLLQLPLGVFLMVNYRITVPTLLMRFAVEQQSRAEVAAIQSILADGGRVLSADYNAVVRLRGRLDVEMAFYNLLVSVGAVDPEPLRRDIAASAFSTIILMEDVRTLTARSISKYPRCPPRSSRRFANTTRLVQRIPGPVLDGIYVYQPAPAPN